MELNAKIVLNKVKTGVEDLFKTIATGETRRQSELNFAETRGWSL